MHLSNTLKFDHFDTEYEGPWKITICRTVRKYNDDYSECLWAVDVTEKHICVDNEWELWPRLRKGLINWFKAELDQSYFERLQKDPDHFKRKRKKTIL